ncbi:MAG: UDP-N-acetylmuramate dehydrogenase [Alphaproteobacteria bacterium]
MQDLVAPTTDSLIDRLPQVRGKLRAQADLSKVTWFRVGGPADVVFRPADLEDLQSFLATCPEDVPVLALGVGSNLLVRDGGLDGVVIRLPRAFAGITAEQGGRIRAGAAALDLNVAKYAAGQGLAGLEFLSGIPGTIGGALRMNAGAYGAETRDRLISARVVDRQGKLHELTAEQMGMAYRHCDVAPDWIFIDALFQCEPGEPAEISARIAEIQATREASQPIRSRTGGSTFANPDGHSAWKLVDQAGCRGLQVGGAQVSEKHCNFLINTGTATASDLETLGETVRKRVAETSGVELRWEIRRIGKPQQETSS